MFKRKQDVDKHVQSILRKKKDEKERYAFGYQIARMYREVNENETARRYLASFLQVRDNSSQGHQLMGEINESLGNVDAAIESYKRALDSGAFSSSNRHLVLKICELFCEQGTDMPRMKYWLEKCESLYPKSEVIYRLKAQIAAMSSNGTTDHTEMEKIILNELINRPCDVDLRIKLLELYVATGRIDEAYGAAVNTDLTTGFASNLQWYQCLQNVFKIYRERNVPEPAFLQLHLHVLRNLVYLSIACKNISDCEAAMRRFDVELKVADTFAHQDEAWLAMCGEMKGQFLYLAGLMILKRATIGTLSWQEANQMGGACFLASQKVSPLDAQAPWFVKPTEGYSKHYQWWHLQSYDRLSQIGHMIRQLAGKDVADWSKSVCRQIMTGMGHKRVFEALYTNSDSQDLCDSSYFYGSQLMVGKFLEPLSWRQLLDIDRVACQVHLGNMSNLVWLCLQRFTPEMKAQPNYHFSLMENMRFSNKNLESGSCESLCQLDILTFLLATVRCAASSLLESMFLYQDSSGRPTLLPASLNKPLCTVEQAEWWKTMYQFCTNSVKDDHSRLRRVLVRGIEAVRLVGSHGVSVAMQCHLARCLDAKVESLKRGELGSRCSASELSALEDRAVFYWTKAKSALDKMKRNQQLPLVKNSLFRESGDTDLTARQVEQCVEEALFAIAKASYSRGKYEEALEVFKNHQSPWASYYCGEIFMNQAAACGENRQDDLYKPLIRKARDCFYQTLDRLDGDRTHELNIRVSKGLDDLEVEIQSFDWDDRVDGGRDSIQNLSDTSVISRRGPAFDSVCSTPRPVGSHSSPAVNGSSPPGLTFENTADTTIPIHSVSSSSNQQPRPSPERLESQIKSLGYSQTTLFKMVLDRNEELVLMHSRMMEEHRNNNNDLKMVLTENKIMMEELKAVLTENKLLVDKQKVESKQVMDGLKKENKEMMEELKAESKQVMDGLKKENKDMMAELKSLMIETRDMLKLMKADLATLKPGMMPAQALPPGPPIIMGPHIPPTAGRGPFPGFPQPAVVPPYPGYLLNSGMPPPPPQAPGNYRSGGLSGARLPTLGKYKNSGDEDEDDDEQDNGEDLSAVYAEYFDHDPSLSQYFTPDSHMQEWSLRAQLDNTMPMSPAIQPPRMAMPQPGFFASALRGQSLQYAQTGQPSPTSAPNLIRPGFFSTPVPANFPTPPASTVASTLNTSGLVSGTSNPFSSLGSMANTSATTSQTPSSTWGTPASSSGGFEVLMVVRAHFPARGATGAITILSTPINKSSVVMVSDAKEMLFHHDILGLRLESTTRDVVSWSALKIGSVARESVTVKVVNEAESETLKRMLLKHAVSSVKPSESGQVSTAAAGVVSSSAASSTTPAASVPTSTPVGGETDPSKSVLGMFTFSGTPKVTPDTSASDRDKAVPHKASPSLVNDDTPKPFAGFSFTLGASTASTPQQSQVQTPPTASVAGSKTDTSITKTPTRSSQPALAAGSRMFGKGDDERIDEYEPNIDFKPVIKLPDLVEKKTGEEEETTLFADRCRMFRYDQSTSQWKERGIGELKILSDKTDVRFRVVMRRDQVLKLCANHYISEDMKLSPLATSDKAWCYFAMDYSDEEMKSENLAVKFKNAEKAKKFKDVFTKCQDLMKVKGKEGAATATPEKPSPAKAEAATASSPAASTTPTTTGTWAGLFKPKVGSWECPGCYIRSDAEVLKCPACETRKPGTGPATTSATTTTSSATSSWGDLFKPKTGSWECTGCYIRNGADVLKCPACETRKPGVSKEDLPKSEGSTAGAFCSGASGFSFGSAGGFKFGSPAGADSNPPSIFGNSAVASKSDPPSQTAPIQGGFSFKPSGGFSFGSSAPASTATTAPSTGPSGGFTYPPVVTTAPSVGNNSGFAFGSTATAATTSTTTATAPSTVGGFTMAPSGGFTFGNTPKTTPTTTSSAVSVTTASNAFVTSSSVGADLTPSNQSKDKAEDSLLASLLTADDTDGADTKGNAFNFSLTPSKPVTSGSLFGHPAATTAASSMPSGSGFAFTFNKTPPQTFVKSPPVNVRSSKPVPSSPEVDEQGLYVTKEGDDTHIHFEPIVRLPQTEIKTGEEDEDVLFESRGKMYRFANGEWKERGLGVVKILQHRQNKTARIVMRRDRILKLCCNHRIDPSLALQPMKNTDGKAWVWYALDFSDEEPKMEQLALRLRNAEIASEFKDVFDRCKAVAPAAKTEAGSSSEQQEGEDDDVIFVKEEFPVQKAGMVKTEPDNDVVFVKKEEATREQIAEARSWKLPDHFYLYQNKPRCPGCLGCTDGEGLPPWASKATPEKPASSSPAFSKPAEITPQGKVFGQTPAAGSVPDFAQLSQGEPSKPVFGQGMGSDFSSLVKQPSSNGIAFKKAEASSPFKFQGAGQALFGTTSPGGGGGDEDAAPTNSDIHFEPVIPLPDLVEVKTGEEEWTVLFTHRAKLYKFHKSANQWKECGVGDIKVMRHQEKVQFRILLRRDQILKLACNHLISTDMNLKPMASSETAWCWVALDLSDADAEASVEQFAVRFKKKNIAEDFKTTFEDCQAKLREASEENATQGNENEAISLRHETGLKPERLGKSKYVALGDKGNVYHTKALDVLERDVVQPSSYTPLGQGEVKEQTLTQSTSVPLGDKGNVYHTKALDVLERDVVQPSSYIPLGQGEVKEQTLTQSTSVPLGDKGNVYHTKALDVLERDVVQPSSYTPLGQGEVKEHTLTQSTSVPLGDKGNVYHTKALDVLERDVVQPSSYTPLGQGEVKEHTLTQSTSVPLGDKGNVYHTKALDVLERDVVQPSSYTPLGQGEVKEHTLTQSTSVPLGDKGNVYHTKALDVLERDVVQPSSYTPLGQGEVKEQTLTQSTTVPLGDKGNVYHTKALDVLERDVVQPSSYTPLGQGEVKEHTLTQSTSAPLGDKGNVYHTKALDVLERDVVQPSSYTPLGQGEVKEQTLTQSTSVPLGDKGNVYHTKALDVLERDVVQPSSYTPLGQGEVKEHTLTQSTSVPLGDKGNVYHTKALDVLERDVVQPSSYTPLGQGEVKEHTLTKSTSVPLGDKGNVYHTKALDVLERDVVQPSSYTPLGQGEVKEHTLTQSTFVPLGDKGNVYHTKALDVLERDVVQPSSYTPLGQGEVKEQTLTQSTSVPLGDKGNVYHTKALDVLERDVVQPSSYTPLGQGEVKDQTLTQITSVPLGDQGNVYHTKALDVLERDVVQPSSYTPLGQGEVKEQTLTQSTSVPLGDKGNVYHTKALVVLERDVVQPSSYTPLGQGEVKEHTLTQSTSVPLGDKGNVYHTKALDVLERDVVQPSSYTPLGQGEVKEQTLTQRTSVPLGDKGNVYHTKALDVLERDVVQPSSYTPLGQGEVKEQTMTQSTSVPLGDKDNVYHTKALDVLERDVVQPSSYTPLGQGEVKEQTLTQSTSVPLGDKGNVYHTKALDVLERDVVQPSSYTPLGQGEVKEQTLTQCTSVPLGDKGNVYHTKALDVLERDVVQPSSYTPLGQGEVKEQTLTQSTSVPLGDKGNVYHTKALDVLERDVVQLSSYKPLFPKHMDTETQKMDPFGSKPNVPCPTGPQLLSYAAIVKSGATSSSPPSSFTLDPTSSRQLIDQACSVRSPSVLPDAVTSTTSADNPLVQAEEEEAYEDEEEEEERAIFEKRATLSCYENEWKKLGMGLLLVRYNEDVNGYSVDFYSDDSETLCRHIICREHRISLNPKTRGCEWRPIDYSMDEPIRRQFRATFSSGPAAEEFAKVFIEGQSLAVDSEISETLSTEIDVPEVFSGGEPRH